MKVIKVICENNTRPCVKRRMSFCACAKSRDLLKVSYVSYCSRSRRRRFTVLDFKSWAYSRIYGHFQQHLYCPDPDFLLQCKIPAIWPRFPLILHFLKFWMSTIFLLPVCLTYWPRKYTTPSLKLIWLSTVELQRFLSADTSRDLVTLTFDLLTLSSCHTWRVTWPNLPPSLKTLRQFIHEIRVITFPIDNHRKCVRGHCACAESREPWVGGQTQLHIWIPRPRFAYSLYNFYWATTTAKGRLLSSRPMLKPFSGEKIVPSKWSQKCRFWGKMGVETLDFGFATPKRHSLRGTASFDVFCVKIGVRVSALAFLKKTQKCSLCVEGREITHAQNRNP